MISKAYSGNQSKDLIHIAAVCHSMNLVAQRVSSCFLEIRVSMQSFKSSVHFALEWKNDMSCTVSNAVSMAGILIVLAALRLRQCIAQWN